MEQNVDNVVTHTPHSAIKPVAEAFEAHHRVPEAPKRFHRLRRRVDVIRRLPGRAVQYMRSRSDPPFHDWFHD